jgi:succinate-semialdehyde dehydrogenase/glutarate-semialdehyde dehydrogenase
MLTLSRFPLSSKKLAGQRFFSALQPYMEFLPSSAVSLESSAFPHSFPVLDPCTNETIAYVAHSSHAVTAAAINATIVAQASAAQVFAATSSVHRSKLLTDLSSAIMANKDSLAAIMSLESGKPVRESLGEVAYSTSYLDFYAASATRPEGIGGGTLIPSPFASPDSPAKRGKLVAMNCSVGVCGFITPWNFPLAMLARKAGPAIAAGCPTLTKPSEHTPLTALALETIARSVGLPEELFKIHALPRTQSKLFGDIVCEHPSVAKLSFTGSTAVGKYLQSKAAESSIVKRLSLELGGNAPFIVCQDADISIAVASALSSKFRFAGQTCVCSDRFLVHEDRHDEFVSALAAAVEAMTIGGGAENKDISPLINPEAVELMKVRVAQAVDSGATVVTGGQSVDHKGGNYFAPTILIGVVPQADCFRHENFGPVVSVSKFQDDEEALAIIEATSEAGLACYVMTESYRRMEMYSSRLQFGLVGINEGIISTAHAPFGGVKMSGIGREGSVEGLKEYTYQKYVYQHC